jgi:hypothetical protein
MFFNKRAELALSMAQDAKSTIEKHMETCELRHGQIQKSLANQDVTLEKIRSFLSRCMWGIIAGLIAIVWWGITSSVHIQIAEPAQQQRSSRAK